MSASLLEQIPHRGPMRWVDEVASASEGRVECRTRLRDGHLLAESGHISPLIALELFAQSAAVLMASRKAEGGETDPVNGALVGTRKLDVFVDELRVGDELTTVAQEKWTAGALTQLTCELRRDGETIARGAVNVATAPL